LGSREAQRKLIDRNPVNLDAPEKNSNNKRDEAMQVEKVKEEVLLG
jgi:hypothetical protein